MANNYEQIMAVLRDAQGNAKNIMGLSNAIVRDNGIPLDLSSIYGSYNDAVVYAAVNAIAYQGQPIAVITETDATLYVITPVSQGKVTVGETEYDVYLKEVGAKTLGDDHSIVLGDDGVLSLYGFEAAASATLPRKNPTTGALEWVSIDQIVQGDGNTKAVVKAADNADITVTAAYDEDSDTYTYTLDAAVPEYTVTRAAGEGITTYTVTKDGEAVGEAIVVPDAYDDTLLAADVANLKTDRDDHKARIESMEAFFNGAAADEGEGESLINALDTLKEIQAYVEADGEVSKDVVANKLAIQTLTGTGEGSVAKAIDDAITEQGIIDAATYATQSALAEVKATADAAAVKTEVEHALTGKVDNATLDNYYLKTETYTQDEVAELLAGITGGSEETVASLLTKLTNHDAANTEKFLSLDNKDIELDKAIEANAKAILAINDAETGLLAQAAADAQDRVDALANAAVAQAAAAAAAAQTAADNAQTAANAAQSTANGNAADILKLNGDANTEGSVKKTVADAVAAIPIATTEVAGLVKASAEVTATEDGALGIGYVSVDKLIQAEGSVLVLDGGHANA